MKLLLTLALVASAVAQNPKTIVNVLEVSGTATVRFAEPNEWGFKALEFDTPAGHSHISLRNPIKCAPTGGFDIERIEGMRLTSTRCIFTGKYTRDGKDHTLLLMLGQGGFTYPDAPNNIVLIGFNAKGQPYKVLELDAFGPLAATEFPTGPGIAGFPDSSEELCTVDPGKPHVTTYDPLAVYIIDATGHANLSSAETETYNRGNYVWAGPRSSEKIEVFYNFPGHHGPFIPPSKEAESLMARYCKSEGK